MTFEVIVWTDGMRVGDYGLYTGFKIFYDSQEIPYFARLFCFYDGKDKRRAEIRFKSEASARRLYALLSDLRGIAMKKKHPPSFTQKNYDWHAAGKLWTFDRVAFTTAPDGEVGISFDELDRMNRLIVNEICRNTNCLSAVELEFLCELTSTNYVDVAKFLHISKATVSQWIRKKGTLSFAESVLLKELFWDKFFGKDVPMAKRHARAVMPEDKLIGMGRYAEEHAIVKGTVRPKVA